MAIAGYGDKSDLVPVTKTIRPTVEPLKNKYRTITVMNDETPLGNLIQYISGNKWTVDYFLQQVAADDVIEPLDTLAPDSLQQYIGIHDLILNLESPLPNETLEGITGNAIIDANIIPQVNDIMKATVLDNREGMFIITGVRRKNYTKEKVYEVEFKLDHFVDKDPSIFENLVNKTVKEYYYDRSFNSKYSTPLLVKSDFDHKQALKRAYIEMTDYYFKTMYSNVDETVIIGQNEKIADKLLENFLYRTMDTDEAPTLYKIYKYSIDDDAMKLNTIWNMLIRRDINMLKYIVNTVGYVNTNIFTTNPVLTAPKMLGIDYVVYPKDVDTILANNKMQAQHKNITTITNPKSGLFNNVNLIPDISNSTYVFGNNFYINAPVGLSRFEELVLRYLKGESINYSELEIFTTTYMLWNRVEQQYYIPILRLIVKDTLYSIYSN